MRLINAVTGSLESFAGRELPRYAILSHRWGDDEVTFSDLSNRETGQAIGNFKFQQTIKQTLEDGLEYVWIDTCCIDKQSSAELSLSINSICSWYGDADRCYVYLHDYDPESEDSSLSACEWFTRGWTWRLVGEKKSMATDLSKITRIHLKALRTGNFRKYSVAQKMSWASRRVTTLIEYQAYCLMGLFDVHMPLLYGEGEGAFLRLQEEIIKDNDDHTIFAWSMENDEFSGLLAPSPDRFFESGELKPDAGYLENHRPFSMTNRGLSIFLRMMPWSPDTYLAILNCASSTAHSPIGIFLRRLSEDDQYARINLNKGGLIFDVHPPRPEDWRRSLERQVSIRKRLRISENQAWLQDRMPCFRVTPGWLPPGSSAQVPKILETEPMLELAWSSWGGIQLAIFLPNNLGHLGAIVAGFDYDFNPVCLLAPPYLENAEHYTRWLQGVTDEWEFHEPDSKKWIQAVKFRGPDCNMLDGAICLQGHRTRELAATLCWDGRQDQKSRLSLTCEDDDGSTVWNLYMDHLPGPFKNRKLKGLDRQSEGELHPLESY